MENKYFDSKEFKKKLKEYEDARLTGNSIFMGSDDLTDIAEYYHSINDNVQAKEVATYAITFFPGSTAPLTFLSRMALLAEDNPEKALHIAEEIEDKNDVEYFYLKAEIMIYCSQVDEADAYLEEKLEYVKAHPSEEVEDEDEEDEEYNSDDDENDEDDDEVDDFCADAASIFLDYNNIEKGEKWLKRCQQTDNDFHRELEAQIALAHGNYTKSERLYNELIDRDPYSSPLWNQLANSQFLHNDIKNSITSSEYSIAINPKDTEALLNKANGLFCLGNVEEAMKYYHRCQEITPDNDVSFLLEAASLITLNRLDEAKEKLLEAEEIGFPDSQNMPEIYRELSFVEGDLGHLRKALHYLSKTNIKKTDIVQYYVIRGHLLMENGKSDEALKSYAKAIDKNDGDIHVYLHIGVSIFDSGFQELAYRMFKIFWEELQNYPNEKEWKDGFAYMAVCAKATDHKDEYKSLVKLAAERNPQEAKKILGEYFPKDMDPREYYEYLCSQPSSEDMEKNEA